MSARIEDFRLLQVLGEGAAGRVHLATPRRGTSYATSGEPLAVKCYKGALLEQQGQIERIKREFDVGATLAHPNLVRMFDYALRPTNGDPFLVMEYVDGVSLLSWISMFHAVPGSIAYKITREIADALAHMHDNGLQHRDLKPANIMVSSTLAAKLMDLGVVRVSADALSEFGSNASLTPDGVTLGTVRNMAPEMLFGEEYDERADVYSLGTIIYALLHGQEVFESEQQWARLTRAVETQEPEFDLGLCHRDQISEQLSVLALSLLSKNPAERPANGGEVVKLLAAIEPLTRGRADSRPVHGYVATALTGLPGDAAEAMAFMSSSIAEVAKTYGIYVYQPRRFTDPLLHPDVDPILVYLTDRRRVAACDLLFVVANSPSFGVGQEIEIAASYGKPTILIARNGTKISRMVTGSFAPILETIIYETPEDLEKKVRRCLRENVEQIRESSVTAKRRADYALGEKLASRRAELGYSTATEFAEATQLSVRLVNALEQGEHENIGVQLLARVCRALELQLSELIDSSPGALKGVAHADASVQELETLARQVSMSAADYFELRDERRREIAARGSGATVSKKEWGSRYQAIERRRLESLDAEEPPQPGQTRLL